MLLLSPADFNQNEFFQKPSFRNTIRLSVGLDPDQDRRSVGPDLGPNCLQSIISRRQKSPLARKELKCRLQGLMRYLGVRIIYN